MGEYLGMKKGSLKFNKCLGFFLGLLFLIFSMPVFASKQNVISSVLITDAKDGSTGYELDIDSTGSSTYKTKIVSDNSIIFELKNSVLSKNPSTYYENVEGIDSVTVEQYARNKVRIFIEGKNAQDTELVFVNSIFEQSSESEKSVIINHPISHYQPTNLNSDTDFEGDNQAWDDNSFNFAHLGASVLTSLKDGVMGVVLIFALIFAIVLLIVKNIAKNYAQDSDPLIGLNNVNTIKDMPSAYSQDVSKIESNLKGISDRSETIKKAQKELAKAHQKYQEYLRDKYKNQYSEKLKQQVNIDAVKKGIALSQYQKSNKNPYVNQEVVRINQNFSKVSQDKDGFQIPPRPKREFERDFTSPYIQRKTSKIDYSPKNYSKQKDTSMRFLESVTKIYEQSGRGDLANGLKNSISKVKQSI